MAMKRPLSSGGWGPRQRVSCRRVVWASLTPFLAAVMVGTLVFRAGHGSGRASQEAVVQRHPARILEETLPCPGTNCELQGGSAAPINAAASSNSAAPAAARAAWSGGTPAPGDLPKLFLFIGILSGRGYRHRRLAVREAWANKAQTPGQVVSKFILSEDERTPQVEKELEAYGDIVFVREKTNYKSILYKTFYVLEYAAQNYDAAFVLKTDDDAFINVQPMIAQLRSLCENPGCVNERLYMGRMAKHSQVLLQPGHKWNNMAFHDHTGLKEYPNYMMGGGYVMGGEVARVLVDVHSRMHLKFTPIEDATLGFWLMAMDLRHVDHPRFYTWAAPCCFKAPIRKPGERFVSRFQLTDDFERHMCSTDPWLVLHKIDSPTKMRYVGARVANCSAPEPWVLPASIQHYYSEQTRQQWKEQRESFLRAEGRPFDSPPPPPPAAKPAAKDGDDSEGGASSSGAAVKADASSGTASAAGSAAGSTTAAAAGSDAATTGAASADTSAGAGGQAAVATGSSSSSAASGSGSLASSLASGVAGSGAGGGAAAADPRAVSQVGGAGDAAATLADPSATAGSIAAAGSAAAGVLAGGAADGATMQQ